MVSSEMRAPAKNSHLRAPSRPPLLIHRPYQLHLTHVRPTALQLMHEERKREKKTHKKRMERQKRLAKTNDL